MNTMQRTFKCAALYFVRHDASLVLHRGANHGATSG